MGLTVNDVDDFQPSALFVAQQAVCLVVGAMIARRTSHTAGPMRHVEYDPRFGPWYDMTPPDAPAPRARPTPISFPSYAHTAVGLGAPHYAMPPARPDQAPPSAGRAAYGLLLAATPSAIAEIPQWRSRGSAWSTTRAGTESAAPE